MHVHYKTKYAAGVLIKSLQEACMKGDLAELCVSQCWGININLIHVQYKV